MCRGSLSFLGSVSSERRQRRRQRQRQRLRTNTTSGRSLSKVAVSYREPLNEQSMWLKLPERFIGVGDWPKLRSSAAAAAATTLTELSILVVEGRTVKINTKKKPVDMSSCLILLDFSLNSRAWPGGDPGGVSKSCCSERNPKAAPEKSFQSSRSEALNAALEHYRSIGSSITTSVWDCGPPGTRRAPICLEISSFISPKTRCE